MIFINADLRWLFHFICISLNIVLPYLSIDAKAAEINPEKPSLAQNSQDDEGPHLPSISDYSCKASEHKGLKDRHFPSSLETKPKILRVPIQHRDLFSSISSGNFYHIKDISPDFLRSLDTNALHLLFDILRDTNLKIKWKDSASRTRSGVKVLGVHRKRWDRGNGLGALALNMGILGEDKLLEKIISYHPEATLPILKNSAAAIISVDVAAGAIRKILTEVHRYDSRQVAAAASLIAGTYIRYWAEDNANCLVYALTSLIVKTAHITIRDRLEFTAKQKGILLGALLAAALTYSQEIKSRSEKHIWIVNAVANLAWATTALVSLVPVAITVGAAVVATVSISAVVWAVVVSRVGFHNFTPKIKEIEGHVEFAVLELADEKTPMLELLETLAWMRAAIHINKEFD